MVAWRRSPIAVFLLAGTLAAAHAAPASADLIDLSDPILPVPTVTPLELPDVRGLPIVRDMPVVNELPDIRELPVVRDVTTPAATPAPAPSATPVPRVTPAPSTGSGESGGNAPSGGDSSAGGVSEGGSAPAPASDARGGKPGAGTSRTTSSRATRARSGAPGSEAPTPGERRERRLRRTVRRLSGCLDALAAGSRQVLVLRAGIGLRAPLSRRAVAERLDASLRQVARRERRGLHDLRRAARAGRCGSNPAAVAVAPISHGDPPTVAGEPGSTHAIGDAEPTGRSGVEDEFRSGPAEPPAARILRVDGDDGPPIPLVLALAFLAGFSVVWALQHRGGRVA
jgi:hypothetical protein